MRKGMEACPDDPAFWTLPSSHPLAGYDSRQHMNAGYFTSCFKELRGALAPFCRWDREENSPSWALKKDVHQQGHPAPGHLSPMQLG